MLVELQLAHPEKPRRHTSVQIAAHQPAIARSPRKDADQAGNETHGGLGGRHPDLRQSRGMAMGGG